MVDGVLGQVLNYRSRQRGLDLEEERMRQNQEYRQAQLGQYERGLDLNERQVKIAEADLIRKDKNRQALAGISPFLENLEIGDREKGGNLLELSKSEATYAGLKSGKYKALLIQQGNTLKRPPGFTFDDARVETVSGESFLTLTGTYESGEPGVATREAGSGADETVIRLSLDEGIDLLNERLQLSLNELDPEDLINIKARIIGASEARNTQQQELENQSEISAALQAKVSLAQDALLERDVLGALSELKGNAKREYMLKLGREFLDPNDPETAERLNLLEQTIKDSKVKKETPDEELARLERIAASGAFANEGFTGQEELNTRIAELKKDKAPSVKVSSLGEKLALNNTVGKRRVTGSKLTKLKEEQERLAGNEREKLKRGRKTSAPIGIQAFNEDIQKLNELIANEDRAGLKQGYQNRKDQLVEQRKEAVKKFNKVNEEYSDYVVGAIDKEISKLENTTNPTEDQTNQLAELNKEKEQLIKSGATTKSMAAPEFKGIEEKLRKIIDPDDNISQFKDVSSEFRADIVSTIDAAVDSGQLTFTEKEAQIAAKAFEEANVQRIQDFKNKLPPDRQLIAYAILSVMAPDAEQRTAVANLLEITATGGDAVGTDLDKFKATTSRMTAETGMLNAQTKRLEAINAARKSATDEDKEVYDNIEEFGTEEAVPVIASMRDPNWINGTDEDGNSNLQKVNQLLLELRQKKRLPTFRASGNPKLSRTLMGDLERQLVSAAIGGLVDKNLFGGSTPVELDDVNLENLYLNDSDPEQATKVLYQTGTGRPQEISIKDFRSQIGLKEIRDAVITIAGENTKARSGQE